MSGDGESRTRRAVRPSRLANERPAPMGPASPEKQNAKVCFCRHLRAPTKSAKAVCLPSRWNQSDVLATPSHLQASPRQSHGHDRRIKFRGERLTFITVQTSCRERLGHSGFKIAQTCGVSQYRPGFEKRCPQDSYDSLTAYPVNMVQGKATMFLSRWRISRPLCSSNPPEVLG